MIEHPNPSPILPSNISLKGTRDNTVKVQWTADPNIPSQSFGAIHIDLFNDKGRKIDTRIVTDDEQLSVTFRNNQLQPGGRYSLRIRTVKNGIYSKESPRKWVTLPKLGFSIISSVSRAA